MPVICRGSCDCQCDDPVDCECCTGQRVEPMRKTNKDNLPATRRACGNCGKLGHLVRSCQNQAKAHDKIGVEVEGWWYKDRWSEVESTADNWHMSGTDDGSLAYDDTGETKAYEFRTRPGSLGEQISQVIAIYPDKCDPSAGMHIHMSFKDVADIMALASPDFLVYFRQRWEAWGQRMEIHRNSSFWSRLRGDNNYCKVNDPTQIRGNLLRGDRYRQINYTAYSGHRTLECRMLPLFRDARIAVSALEEWVSIVEDFIAQVAPLVWAKMDKDLSLEFEAVGRYDREIDLETVQPDEDFERFTRPLREEEIALDSIRVRHPQTRVWTEYQTERVIESEVSTPTLETVDLVNEVAVIDPQPPTPGHRRLFGARARELQTLLRSYGFADVLRGI